MIELVTFSELVDKLMIVNIKLYILMDKIAEYSTLEKLSEKEAIILLSLNKDQIRLVKQRSGLKSAIGAGTRSSGSFDTRPLAAALTVTGLAGAHAYGSKGRYAYKARKVESNDILKKEKYLANMGRTRYLDRVKSRKDKKK